MFKNFTIKRFFLIILILLLIIENIALRKQVIRILHIFDRYNSAGTEYVNRKGLGLLNTENYLPWGIKPLEAAIITDFRIRASTKYSYFFPLSPNYIIELFFNKKYRLYKVDYNYYIPFSYNPIRSEREKFFIEKIDKGRTSIPLLNFLIKLTWNDDGHQITETGDESVIEKNLWIYEEHKEVFTDKALVFEEYWYYEKLRIGLCIKQVDDQIVLTVSYTNILLEKEGHFEQES